MRFVYQATEPLLEPIRRVLPPQGGIDFSPMVLLFGLYILRILLFSLL
jgi:YggT family protein